jgi:hypothetical protein
MIMNSKYLWLETLKYFSSCDIYIKRRNTFGYNKYLAS